MTETANHTEALLSEIARKGSTRDSIAAIYRNGIRAHQHTTECVDWAAVNAAILARFKPSGLNYIKFKGWKR